MPENAHTIIIGGGVVGCSIAYHLARGLNSIAEKKNNVVLLEKTELTAGSTWHAAGLTTAYHPIVSCKKLHWNSLNFFAHLHRETGLDLGFHRTGSIRLANSPLRQLKLS